MPKNSGNTEHEAGDARSAVMDYNCSTAVSRCTSQVTAASALVDAQPALTTAHVLTSLSPPASPTGPGRHSSAFMRAGGTQSGWRLCGIYRPEVPSGQPSRLLVGLLVRAKRSRIFLAT
jgi:hypothetical protein